MQAEAAPEAATTLAPRTRGVPLTGFSDLTLRLPVRLQVRLAAESILTGNAADDLAARAIELYLAATQAQRETN